MKIKKAATARHEATLSPFVRSFVAKATAAPRSELLSVLSTFPVRWPFPRGDLYHWIPLLDRIDSILEEHIHKYKLKDGPQTIPCEPAEKEVIIGVLDFTRVLVENCGNRSLYASSGNISELLNSTDLDILFSSLYLASRIAQRYYTSRTRGTNTNQATLLQSHYNIDLEKVVKLASPFPKSIGVADIPGGKSVSAKAVLPVYATDLGRIARGENPLNSTASVSKGKGKAAGSKEGSWDEWGGVWVSYYSNPKVPSASTAPGPTGVLFSNNQSTPSPVRRHSTLHHSTSAAQTSPTVSRSRGGAVDEVMTDIANPAVTGGLQTLEISHTRIKEATNLEEIVQLTLPELPSECHYEFLNRLRVASALAGDIESRRKILGIRILALTNLAYVHPEPIFIQKVLALDQDEPRRLQLAYQLAELVQTGDGIGKEGEVPRWLQTLALSGLEALARHKVRIADVSNALSLNVNHGVLFYIMRKVLAELSVDDDGDDGNEAEQWREALFSLVGYLPTTSHTGSLLVSAGLIPLLVDMINLRTSRGLRHVPKAINLLDQLVYNVQNAFQIFANAQGLDAVVDLVAYETKAGLEEVENGTGIPDQYRTEQTDYKISHYRQQTLRMSAKFMQHIMSQSGANVDRLLRNLVDNPKLLESIRLVIGRGDVWGSHIWSTIVSMISAFIHNEPTSYAVVHEAHITHAFLEAITGRTGLAEDEVRAKKEKEEAEERARAAESAAEQTPALASSSQQDDEPMSDAGNVTATTLSSEIRPTDKSLPSSRRPASGIMPSQDAISCIPTAFGAICLNQAGLDLIRLSGALDSFFEIFESPVHVKVLTDGELDNVLGNQFDELIRHHPVLRDSVMTSTMSMLKKIIQVGEKYAAEKGLGAKVWLDDGQGGLVVSGGRRALIGKHDEPTAGEGPSTTSAGSGSNADNDVEMTDATRLVRTVTVGETHPDGSVIGQTVTLADIIDEEDEAAQKDVLSIATFIDVAARYLEGFVHTPGQSREFIRQGGLETLLAFYNIPSLPYDFATSQANQTFCRVFQQLGEHCLVDTLKLVFISAQTAISKLEPLLQYNKKKPFFAPLTNPESKSAAIAPPRLRSGVPASDVIQEDAMDINMEAEADRQAIENIKANGTALIKDLVTIHSLSYLLQYLYRHTMFNVRQSVPVFLETTQDMDRDGLITRLGTLQRQCVWEEILLQGAIPSTWDAATRTKDGVARTATAIEEVAALSQDATQAGNDDSSKSKEEKKDAQKAAVERDGKTSWFRNVKTIRFLIGQIPTTINPFLQGLAKCVINRRSNELSHKYLALKLVDSIAESMHTHLTWARIETSDSITEKYGYWIVMLSAVMCLLLEGVSNDYFVTPKNTPPERQPLVLTTTLVTFKQKDGIEVIKAILEIFWEELRSLPPVDQSQNLTKEEQRRMAHAYAGLRICLSLFAHLVSNKAVLDSTQSQALHHRSVKDCDRPDYFNTNQLLVELRAAIMPIVARMWEAETLDKASSSMIKSVVEILGIILKGEGEGSAFTRKNWEDTPKLKNELSWRTMMPPDEQIKQLTEMGFSREAAADALDRCNEMEAAANWLSSQPNERAALEPPPRPESHMEDDDEEDEGDDDDEEDEDGTDIDVVDIRGDGAETTLDPTAEPVTEPATEAIGTSSTTGAIPPVPAPSIPASVTVIAEPGVVNVMPPPPPPPAPEPPITRSGVRIDDLLAPMPIGSEDSGISSDWAEEASTAANKGKGKEVEEKEKAPRGVAIEDLEELRGAVRETLVGRCLDVIQNHSDTTFELADLLKSAFSKSAADKREEVASTIIYTLHSLQDDDFRPQAKIISSTAHLLGLLVQDPPFYEAAIEALKDNFGTFISFVKIYRGDPAPWVAYILLILEKLLSESAQPDKIKFTPGHTDQEVVVENVGIIVIDEDQHSLFDAVVPILPDIEKDEAISVAVARILVLLTRRRDLATKLTEGGRLQKLFHMYRRQAGNRVDRLQSSMMIILRHIVEDDDTLKAIMRAEIRTYFSARGARQLDTNSFTKSCFHLILRNPDVFVDVVEELCKLVRYDPNLRNQGLMLKDSEREKLAEAATSDEQKAIEGISGESSESKPEVEGSNDAQKGEKDVTEKPKPAQELKAPGVENPDGVIHFLLTELFAIKDVKDFILQPAKKEETAEAPAVTAGSGEAAPSASTEKATEETKPEKPDFKVEQHPYFFYRAFLLMSLAELVCCYNRCKIEFINFNRKASPKDPITPSKPRSAVFNYLLNDLISQQSLIAPDDWDKKKRSTLAEWSQGVFVSLCTHTGEVPTNEDEPDLLFVRKFVCETSLRAFKDACASTEPLDIKYAKMMSLSETFYRILCGRPQSASAYATSADKTQLQIARIMLDKNYISALTNALAEVDLNFPDASKRVIKYMLKTLRLLSKRACDLSETSSISMPGVSDEDEIMTSSSMTDFDDVREETPDLYRGSALGLFEGGGMGADEEGDSYDEEDDDEEMYDDEIGFEEEIIEEDGSEISEDEDDDDIDNGMDVEIVVQDAIGDESDDEDEDDSDDSDMEEGDAIEIDAGHHHHHHHRHHHHRHHHHHDEYDSQGEDDWHSDGSGDVDEPDDELMADNPLETIARALGVGDEPHVLDDDREDGFIDEDAEEDEDLDGEDDEDDLDEEGMGDEFDEDDEGGSAIPWGWAEDDEAPVMTRAQPRGAGGWFTLSGAPREPPAFMSRAGRPRHYLTAGERNPDTQNQNPLLQQQPDVEPVHRPRHHRIGPEFMTDWVHAVDSMQGGGPPGSSPFSMINTLMSIMNRGGGAISAISNGTIQFQATIPRVDRHLPPSMHREFRNMYGNYRQSHETPRHRDAESIFASLEAGTTNLRWTEEARLLFGNRTEEVAQRVINTILRRLVPPAIEEERIRQEKEEEARQQAQKLEEARKRKEEGERIAKEKAEAEEKARKEEEELAAERARILAEAAAENAPTEAAEGENSASTEAMENVETTGESAAAAEAGPANPPPPRATVMIRGRAMDITGMDIDPEFLEAIPEDMREEALTQYIRERRATAAANDQPSEISREFLDALPEDIRDELLQQENADRRRREQEQARGAGGAVDIDLATFLATLEPGLRQTVLMEQDEESLAQLPHAIVEEANALRGDRGFHHFGDLPRARGPAGLRRPDPPAPKKPIRKGTVQLLDKAGVATLLRLMFIPQVSNTRTVLHEILLNICENRQNRAEVVNLLLSILQDGSADMVAVERSFAQLCVRAKQVTMQKAPAKPGLSRTNSSVLAQTSGEISPLMVAQQCLHALLFLVNYNEHIPSYFLNEHDIQSGLKRSLSRKGKGKAIDTKASKYALNTLLGLLDRPLITESTSVMEQLSVLLSEITRPLTILLKKDKKKTEEEEKPKEEQATTTEAAADAADAAPSTPVALTDNAMATETATAPAELPAAETSAADTENPKEITSEDDKPKKQRNLVPPVVPEYNLRLVVNILTARECTSKTFKETLTTMQNLSGIPGAKDIFGVELIRQAQELGSVLLQHLDGLLQQIKKAQTGTEVQGMALANFSPASSEQAKLLRVLTALDYLFDPKRAHKDKPEDKKDGESKPAQDSNDVLAKLHQSLAFAPLWGKLSECLTAIHEREDLLHIATILLPSIEALMVVCKNSGLDEKEATKGAQTKPDSEVGTSMRQLFFRFTEDHRKILNQMVRNNPKLMSGSFALLVNNPKVLDFDNKRNYFNRKLHTRQGIRDSHPTLQLNVRRDQVFMDSYKSMYYKSGDEIKFAKLSIRFSGEEGVDAGGVTREWFQVMARQMFNPGYALFIPVASDRTTFHPNSLSGVNSEHLHFFKFIGRIIGKALYEGRVLDCHFSRAVYKQILGKSVSLKDMETLDLEYYKSLVWMLENDITDIITETFSVEIDEFGARRTIDLIPDGHNVPVTEENKQEYVRLMTEHRLLHSVKEQMEHFLQGFHDIVPANLISIFNEQELELLISGMPEIDMDDWRNNTEYHNYNPSSPQIQWFWRAVRSFDKEERAKLLQFVTGTSKVPLNGFKELEGMNGFSKFNIHRDYGNKDRLPSSHTCFNQLDLPEYESYEVLRQQLLTAITQGAEYFGFA